MPEAMSPIGQEKDDRQARGRLATMDRGAVFDVSRETVFVTGASSGLGMRFARVLAANGARVALAGRNGAALERLAAELDAAGAKTAVLPFDVTDRPAMRHAFARAEAELGPVSVLVNNAGIAGPGAAVDIDFADWRRIMDVDLDAAFAIAQEAARRMTSGGNIINVSSILGLRPAADLAAYAVAKAGLAQLSRVMALELAGKSIRVNTLAPGYVVTGMNRDFFAGPGGEAIIRRIAMRRVGQVDDFDGAILFLASNASRFMTGATLVIDGGHTLVI